MARKNKTPNSKAEKLADRRARYAFKKLQAHAEAVMLVNEKKKEIDSAMKGLGWSELTADLGLMVITRLASLISPSPIERRNCLLLSELYAADVFSNLLKEDLFAADVFKKDSN